MGPITSVYKSFKVIDLAGSRWRVSEARVCDLARLQAWIDSCQDDALRLIDDLYALEDESARRRAASVLWDNVDREQPTPFNHGGQELLSTAEGVCQTLAVALSRHHEGITGEEIVAIAGKMDATEFSALSRVFWGAEARPILARMLGCDGGSDGRPVDWPEAVMMVAERYGWSLSEISELTLSQFGTALRGGTPVVYKVRALAGESMADQVARVRRERGYNGDGSPGV